jgi:ABC-type branched-subunit amino acid transport system substrate-binding protein
MNNANIGVLLLVILTCSSLAAAPLTESEARGKQLYVTGGNLKARVGLASIELSGSQLPCISCHGEDGQGRPEGSIVPTNITFEYLTITYGHQHDNGRKHPAFTPATISTAISEGIDSAGNRLDDAMPRYTLSERDSIDLIAYLKRLATDVDAGLSDTTIRLGTLLPTDEIGRAIKGILSAYFDEINAQGGIYNRKIQLDVAESTNNSESTLNNTRRLLETEPVFALIAPFAGNLQAEILLLTEQHGIPQIGSYTLFPEENVNRSQSAFYLLPSLNDEARAMVDYAADVLKLKKPNALIVRPENDHSQKAALAIEQQSQTRGLGAVTQIQFQPETVAAHLPDVIYFLGARDELDRLLKAINTMKPRPLVFASGSLTGAKVTGDKVFLSFPTPPHDNNADEFFQLIKHHQLTTQHLTSQAVAYSAAKLLMAGLQKTGRELSRKKLVDALEHIYQFDTGVMSPLSYSSNRHIGSAAVAIVPISTD